MSIKPILVPDQDAKTLRALLESFDAAATGTAKKQLTESVEQGVAEGSENFTITHQKDRSFPGSTQVVVTDKNTGKQKVIAGDPKKIRQQLKHEFGIDYNFEQQGVAEGRDDDDDIWTSSKSGGPKGLPQGRRGQTGREQSYDVYKKYDDYAPDDEGDDWYDDLDEASPPGGFKPGDRVEVQGQKGPKGSTTGVFVQQIPTQAGQKPMYAFRFDDKQYPGNTYDTVSGNNIFPVTVAESIDPVEQLRADIKRFVQ